MLVDYLESSIRIDQPINIHLTGCHHSCAQHYIADIGLLATKVEQGDELVEGYDLFVGGRAGEHQKLGRRVREKIAFDELPPIVLGLLRAWLEQRRGAEEDFQEFTARLTDEELTRLAQPEMEAV